MEQKWLLKKIRTIVLCVGVHQYSGTTSSDAVITKTDRKKLVGISTKCNRNGDWSMVVIHKTSEAKGLVNFLKK